MNKGGLEMIAIGAKGWLAVYVLVMTVLGTGMCLRWVAEWAREWAQERGQRRSWGARDALRRV